MNKAIVSLCVLVFGTPTSSSPDQAADRACSIVEDGATPDDVSDDTAAIQRTLDRCAGKEILIPSGVYFVAPRRGMRATDPILSVASDTTISGMGPRSVIRIKDGAGDYERIFGSSATVTGITFRSFRIDQNPSGNRAADIQVGVAGKAQRAITFWSAEDLRVENMDFRDATGINTVSISGNTSWAMIRDNVFRFVRGATRAPTGRYDNSAVYIEASQQAISGNHFSSDLSNGARAAIETHGGRSSIVANTTVGYETLVNVVSSDKGVRELVPNDISVIGNSVTDAAEAINLWGLSGRTLRNVTIIGNTIHLNNAARGRRDLYAGIRTVHGADAAGGIEGVVITGNVISFDAEDRPEPFPQQIAGILLYKQGPLSDVDVSHNIIRNAPVHGIRVSPFGPGDFASRVRVAFNTVSDAGNNTRCEGGYRSAILVAGSLHDVEVTDNLIADTGTPQPKGNFALNLLQAAGSTVRASRNEITSASGSLRVALGNALTDTKGADGAATEVAIGAVGPASASGITFQRGEVSLYRESRGVLRTNARFETSDAVVAQSYAGKDVPVPFGHAVRIEAGAGDAFTISAARGVPFTVSNPTGGRSGQTIMIRIANEGDGSLGAVRWGSDYRMSAWVSPGAGAARTISFRFDGSRWNETSRTSADVPAR